MISIRNLLFLAVAVTGSVIKRDAATVLKDLRAVNDCTKAVTNAVNGYGGGLIKAAPILKAEQDLKAAIRSATEHAKGVKATETDAQKIINFINKDFLPSIDSSLEALKAKKNNFKNDGLTGAVKQSLQDLKSHSSNYSDALIAGTPAGLQKQAKDIKGKIIGKFDDAINAFS